MKGNGILSGVKSTLIILSLVLAAVFSASVSEATKTVTVNFTFSGSSAGSVTATDGGGNIASLSCSSNCTSAALPNNDTVYVTAVPSLVTQSVFTGWTGCNSTSGAQCTLSLTANKTVTASFAPASRTLTVNFLGTGTGTIAGSDGMGKNISCSSGCVQYFGDSSSVTITATPNSGSVFASWSGCSSTSGNSCTINMSSANRAISVTFNTAVTTTTAVSSTTTTAVSSTTTTAVSSSTTTSTTSTTTTTIAAVNTAMNNYCQGTSIPPFMGSSVPPLLMLDISKDHKNSYKAYNDYSDLDGDGVIDTQYKGTITYYGYFDPTKCYAYSSTSSTYTAAAYLFTPSSVSSTSPATCDGTKWSGNFLNWATMSRMDVLRKVMYGGYRSTDNASMTILERQFLPQDAHSWAKVYTPGTGDPTVSQLTPLANTASITICNTTVADPANPPVMRVASGAWPYWASNERWQCARAGEYNNGSQWESRRPPAATGGYMDYILRVRVCVPSLLGSERCQLYPSGNYKPIGLLQAYGETSKIYFGLMTGSWNLSKSGGVLRKNVGPFTNETNYTTDGTFCVNSSGTAGTACASSTGVPGIVNTMNRMKIYRYNYGSGWSDGTYNSTDGCSWGSQSFTEGNCTNWGDPLGEIYYESLRYFMGKTTPTTAYSTDDSSLDSGLSTLTPVTWQDPYGTYPYCSKPFIMVVSDVSPSFDSNQLPGVNGNFGSGITADIGVGGSLLNVTTQTNIVGGGTGDNVSGNYFIGQSGATGDTQSGVSTNLCTSKAVSSSASLASLRGLCPTGPNFEGSYYIAGMAYWAHVNDLRNSTNTPSNATPGNDNVTTNATTYAIAMNTTLPSLTIPLGTTNQYSVQFIPACYNSTVGNPCTLVNFLIDNGTICNSPPTGGATGRYFVTWEDSPQGGDYDMDADGCIYYKVDNGANPPKITFTVKMTGSSTPYNMNMGYIINGTTTDGPQYLATNCSSTSATPNTGLLTSAACGNFYTTVPASSGTVPSNSANIGSKTHTVNTAAAATNLLNDPLWYAAKWGGFTDSNGNNLPDVQSEWSTGVNGTGVPDNYFLVTNPSTLETQMETAFLRILKQTSSGTAATVLSQRTQAGANILQVLFYPSKYFTGNTEISWVGFLNNLWLYNTSSVQQIREDKVNDYKLNILNDNVINFTVANNVPTIQLYSDTTGGGTLTALSPATETFDELNTIWEAGGNARTPSTQSSTSTSFSGSFYDLYHDNASVRTIYTNNGSGALVLFDTAHAGSFSSAMGSTMVAGASVNDIINYTRGVDKAGLRNRTTQHLGSTTSNVWKLGDIVYSTPLLNEYTPQTGNGLTDNLWVAFVGANDGMLHAFKAGKLSTNALGLGEIEQISGSSLGTEMWGFIPRNSLPYLRYLADPSYSPNSGCHLYFNDLKPYIYTYTPSGSSVPKVVLIGGMRLGGACGCISGSCPSGAGAYNPPTDTCPTPSDATTPMSGCLGLSSYYALDVTNPASPSLLWEFSHPELGFSYSGPAVINNNDSLMVMFLSGPQTYTGRSYQNLKTFTLSLNNDFTINAAATGSSNGVYKYDTGIARAYGGRLFTNGLDVNADGTTDYILFGYTSSPDVSWSKVSGGIVSVFTGGSQPPTSSAAQCTGNPCSTSWANCWYYNTNYFNLSGSVTGKVETDKCFSQYYAFAGTGKYFSALDNYTVVDNSSTALTGDFLYASPFTCNNVGCCSVSVTHQTTSTVSNACNTITAGNPRPDWTFPLNAPQTYNSIPYLGERNISDPTFASNMIFFTSTQPTSDACSFGGRSREIVFNCVTGAAPGGAMDNCSTFTIPTTALQGALFVQTSTSAINKVSVKTGFHTVTSSDSNQSSVNAAGGSMGAVSSWMPGISPESATPYVAPSSASYGKVLNWMER